MMEPTPLNMDKVWININMRCIEILEQNFITLYNYVININMRCIEILHVLYILPTITINIT